MDLRFYIDPETDDAHILKHGVSEHEVEEVLLSVQEDRPGREDSRIAIGQTDRGRFLRVIYTRRTEPGSMFVITAYELTSKQLRAFRRRNRRKGR
jgi:uncharacterized DUF497 family protein